MERRVENKADKETKQGETGMKREMGSERKKRVKREWEKEKGGESLLSWKGAEGCHLQ